MNNFSKSSLIQQNKLNDEKSQSLQNPIGILALFHRKGTVGGTQRFIMEKSDLLSIVNSAKDTKDIALGRIDREVKSNVSIATNQHLAGALANYLPYTQSWSMREKSSGTDEVGFIMNFDVDRVGICTRQVLALDIDSWKSVSTDEQIAHSSGTSFGGNYIKAVPTETILTEEQKEKRRKAVKRAQGLNDYYYGSNQVVWAINKKMADKRARKLGII